MPITTQEDLFWIIPAAIVNFLPCVLLEIRLRRQIRLGLIDERRYTKRQLEEFERLRARMEARDRRRKRA